MKPPPIQALPYTPRVNHHQVTFHGYVGSVNWASSLR